jgi:hypothetical protein
MSYLFPRRLELHQHKLKSSADDLTKQVQSLTTERDNLKKQLASVQGDALNRTVGR